jgi:hypothetical protein
MTVTSQHKTFIFFIDPRSGGSAYSTLCCTIMTQNETDPSDPATQQKTAFALCRNIVTKKLPFENSYRSLATQRNPHRSIATQNGPFMKYSRSCDNKQITWSQLEYLDCIRPRWPCDNCILYLPQPHNQRRASCFMFFDHVIENYHMITTSS